VKIVWVSITAAAARQHPGVHRRAAAIADASGTAPSSSSTAASARTAVLKGWRGRARGRRGPHRALGLAVGGAEGVHNALDILRDELRRDLASAARRA